jgi:AcrR family transcriptional regulator
MVETPWGDADQLRSRQLQPGRGKSREEVERSQRERLFAAMVATVAERGYEATTVADLVKLSGVSRKSFYALFGDKQRCFIAAIEALTGPALETVEAGLEPPGDAELAKGAFETLFGQIVAQPAAAKMCFV